MPRLAGLVVAVVVIPRIRSHPAERPGMRYGALVLAVLTALGVASCGENPPPPAQPAAGNLAKPAAPAGKYVPAAPNVPPAAAPQINERPLAGPARPVN